MYFDKSHSKKDILHTFKSLSVFPDKTLSKREIIESFDSLTEQAIYTKQIPNLSELIIYFNKPSPNKRLSVSDRQEIMLKCKRIILYAKNNYCLDSANYNSHEDVLADCICVHHYGSIPSVRRACKMFNNSPYQGNRRIMPNIPLDVQEELNQKRKYKSEQTMWIKIRRGPILVHFD
jgi:hypothetical protein